MKKPITVTDDLGNNLVMSNLPKRIISLVPSLTELLYDLGLEDRIVGVTKFCIHPETALKEKIKVGGTKQFDFNRIAELQPDLLIANKEENYKEGILKLQAQYPVYVSDIFNLEDALRTIHHIGLLTNAIDLAQSLVANIQTNFNNVQKLTTASVLYLIWQKPYMAVGGNNFVDFILRYLGFHNVVAELPRYPELSLSECQKLNPEYVFLSSEPYPFDKKHLAKFQILFPSSKIILVDGEMFSWYGSRMKLAPAYFESLIVDLE